MLTRFKYLQSPPFRVDMIFKPVSAWDPLRQSANEIMKIHQPSKTALNCCLTLEQPKDGFTSEIPVCCPQTAVSTRRVLCSNFRFDIYEPPGCRSHSDWVSGWLPLGQFLNANMLTRYASAWWSMLVFLQNAWWNKKYEVPHSFKRRNFAKSKRVLVAFDFLGLVWCTTPVHAPNRQFHGEKPNRAESWRYTIGERA
jgi:hypothetical protein